jgi:hypothetical protein
VLFSSLYEAFCNSDADAFEATPTLAWQVVSSSSMSIPSLTLNHKLIANTSNLLEKVMVHKQG